MKTFNPFPSKSVLAKFCLSLFASFLLFSCTQSIESEVIPIQKPSSERVTGIFGNGINLQPSYYNGGNCDLGWNLMKLQTKIKTVRIEIEPNQVNNAKRWIAEAKTNGYTIIATYHDATVLGSDNVIALNNAATWWKNNYNILGGGFTINLINEWGSHNISSSAFANAYNNAISVVRQTYSGKIIIDIPGYGQETATAACAIKGCGGTKINDVNIILSAHIYPSAYNQAKGRALIASDLDDLASAGRTCIIGEFGSVADTGGADWSGIIDRAKTLSWTIIGWTWNGEGYHPEMNMITPQFQPFVNGQPKTYNKNINATAGFNVVYNKL